MKVNKRRVENQQPVVIQNHIFFFTAKNCHFQKLPSKANVMENVNNKK